MAREISWPESVTVSGLNRQLEASLVSPHHAYLFLGSPSLAKTETARLFAAELCADGTQNPAEADRRRRNALAGSHPDLIVVKPRGRGLLDEQAGVIIAEASRKPVLSGRKVILVEEFHTAYATVAPKILKTLEEPAPSVVIVLLASHVRPDHITVASRCVKFVFPAHAASADSCEETCDVTASELCRAHELLFSEWVLSLGVPSESQPRSRSPSADPPINTPEPSEGTNPAESLNGRLGAHDLTRRRDFWLSLPARLDGTGASAALLADEILDLITTAEATAVDAATSRHASAPHASAPESSTERTQRRARLTRGVREAELRFGLAVLLGQYSQNLAGTSAASSARAINLLNAAAKSMIYNPNEKLLALNLLLQLGAPA